MIRDCQKMERDCHASYSGSHILHNNKVLKILNEKHLYLSDVEHWLQVTNIHLTAAEWRVDT